MLRYMLDTNVCIQVIKNRPEALRTRFNANAASLCISVVTLSELLYGAEKSARPEANRINVEQFTARLEVLPFDDDAAAHYGDIRATLERQRTPIGAYDMMIAAHARAHGLVIVTNNTREFTRVQGLRVEDWLSEVAGGSA